MSATSAQIRLRHEEFATKLVALANEYADVCAPSIDPVTADVCDHGRDEVCECHVPDNTLATEWSLLMQWVQLTADDQSWSTAVHAPGMIRSHKLGLLTTHWKAL